MMAQQGQRSLPQMNLREQEQHSLPQMNPLEQVQHNLLLAIIVGKTQLAPIPKLAKNVV